MVMRIDSDASNDEKEGEGEVRGRLRLVEWENEKIND